jgi:hypothetical protein
MNLARLLSTTLVVGVAVTSTIIACGGDDGGTPDAKVFMDAKVYMDAPPGPAGLGKICTGPADCPASAPICGSLGGAMFCTAQCASQAGSGQPPTNSHATCMAFTDTGGTPTCSILQAPSGSNTNYTYFCGIQCGTYMSMNFGTCPTGLTCTGNLCR